MPCSVINPTVTALEMKQEVKPYIQSCPDAKAGGDSRAVEVVEQGHSAQTVGVWTQSGYSQTVRGPRKMA